MGRTRLLLSHYFAKALVYLIANEPLLRSIQGLLASEDCVQRVALLRVVIDKYDLLSGAPSYSNGAKHRHSRDQPTLGRAARSKRRLNFTPVPYILCCQPITTDNG